MAKSTRTSTPAPTPAPATGTALTKAPTPAPSALALVDEALLAGVMDDAGEDLGFRKEDLATPFLRVLQSNSPQAMRGQQGYVEGAQGGMFFNTATSDTYDGQNGILLVPVAFTPSLTEWHPRPEPGQPAPVGKGLVRDHGTDYTALEEAKRANRKSEKGKWLTPAGTELVDGMLYYCILVPTDADGDPILGELPEQVALVLTSTQLKKGRKWNTAMSTATERHPVTGKVFRPAPFYFTYRFTTVPESNARGNWYGVKIDREGKTLELYLREGMDEDQQAEALAAGAALYEMARGFKALIGEGAVKVDHQAGFDGGVAEEAGAEGAGAEGEEDTPF